jgi:hypothetical protein
MRELSEWNLKMHYGEYNYFTLEGLKSIASSNVEFIEEHKAFSSSMLDEFYRDAALVYNSTHFPDGHGGGMECVTMEGALRGAVPLLSKEWVAPWPGAPGLDACYKFDILSNKLNGTENNIPDIVRDIDPLSKEYHDKQCAARDFVVSNYKDTKVCKLLYNTLKDII